MNRCQQRGKGAVEIIEEAVHLLRVSPASLLTTYYIGSLPFILGLLYFWAYMSRNPLADRYCATASFGLAILFMWMKCWQAFFGYALKGRILGEPAPSYTLRSIARLAVEQTLTHLTGFFVLPVAMVMMLPFGWVYAFYQNVSVLSFDEQKDRRMVLRKAWQQAMLWPGQNHVLLAILSLFGLFVFINLAMGFLCLPWLVRSLLGIETIFSKSGWGILNSTFLAIMCGLTYLCVDPLVKTVYALRCFYGSSIRTGEDLQAELRGVVSPKATLAVLVILLMGTITVNVSSAYGDANPRPHRQQLTMSSISPTELDRSIAEVMSRPEYTWRMPRGKTPREERDQTGVLARVIGGVVEIFRRMTKTVGRWIDKILEWLENMAPRANGRREPSSPRWMGIVRVLIVVLLACSVLALAVMVWRSWRRRAEQSKAVACAAIGATPDLKDEQLVADELPVGRWLGLARDMLEKKELRLALRAFYLANLAHLAECEMITIAKYKSNREYEGELQRRAHDHPSLVSVFSNLVAVFDRAWYGMHDVSEEDIQRFCVGQERIMAFHAR